MLTISTWRFQHTNVWSIYKISDNSEHFQLLSFSWPLGHDEEKEMEAPTRNDNKLVGLPDDFENAIFYHIYYCWKWQNLKILATLIDLQTLAINKIRLICFWEEFWVFFAPFILPLLAKIPSFWHILARRSEKTWKKLLHFWSKGEKLKMRIKTRKR